MGKHYTAAIFGREPTPAAVYSPLAFVLCALLCHRQVLLPGNVALATSSNTSACVSVQLQTNYFQVLLHG